MKERPRKTRRSAAGSEKKTGRGRPTQSVDERISQERVRLGRDLHDWLLQSLTGVALDLQSLPKLVDSDPEKAKARVKRIQEAVATEQRELRAFIEDLRLMRSHGDETPTLNERLTGLAHRFKEQWDLVVELDFDPVVHLAPDEIQREIYALVAEAVSNAAKHSACKSVSVRVRRDDAAVCVTIEDDGRGFQFLGRYTLAQLIEMKRGPVTLKERIQSLGGDMVVSSTTGGVIVEVHIPVKRGVGDGDTTADCR